MADRALLEGWSWEGVLLPRVLYDAVGPITGNPVMGNGGAQYTDLYVIAARVDPCFAVTDPDPHGNGCLNQLRLVVQGVSAPDGGTPTAFDSALHLFYSLTRQQLENLASDLVALRQANGGEGDLGSIQPHPLMVRQGLSGAYASGLRKLILEYAGAQNLTRVTELDSSFAVWTFQGFDVSNALQTVYTPMVIPTLPGSATQGKFEPNVGKNQGMNGVFLPETTAAADYAPLANLDAGYQLSPAARQAAFDGLIQIENPTRYTPNTIDCVSCHVATPTELDNVVPNFGLTEVGNPNAFVPDASFVSSGDTGVTFAPTGAFSVHAFSYVGTVPTVNKRVVNETAAIVAYLNTLP